MVDHRRNPISQDIVSSRNRRQISSDERKSFLTMTALICGRQGGCRVWRECVWVGWGWDEDGMETVRIHTPDKTCCKTIRSKSSRQYDAVLLADSMYTGVCSCLSDEYSSFTTLITQRQGYRPSSKRAKPEKEASSTSDTKISSRHPPPPLHTLATPCCPLYPLPGHRWSECLQHPRLSTEASGRKAGTSFRFIMD